MNLSFIIIDNSELDCFIARKLIEQTMANATVKIFREATEALEYMAPASANNNLNIVFLDLRMPGMNGFQFIESFGKQLQEIQDNYFIAVLTSSMNKNELTRLMKYSIIHRVLEKPLTVEKLHEVINLADPGSGERQISG
jgi:DNA-binding NarL/FixJ family response regulator